jgi:hypothetical protein
MSLPTRASARALVSILAIGAIALAGCDELESIERVGARRAEAGIPLEDLLHAYRTVSRVCWDVLAEECRAYRGDALEAASQTARIRLEPLRDIHLNSGIAVPNTITGDRQVVYFFGIVALLTDDAWLTMPPEPYEYQGRPAIARFLDDRAERRGAPLRLVPTRANGQPAFGCYLPDPQVPIARAYSIVVLTLADDRIAAITWFGERSLVARFGLPRTLPVGPLKNDRSD